MLILQGGRDCQVSPKYRSRGAAPACKTGAMAVASADRRRPVRGARPKSYLRVTLADDLTRWETCLAGRPDVTIRVCNAGNHLLFRGTGEPAPAQYEPAQHVDPAVVADIADWVLTTAGPAGFS
jgi:hypothetical protein